MNMNLSIFKLARACVCVFGLVFGVQAQQGPIIRNPITTNQFMNQPANLMIPFWNSAAGKWSNAVNNAATATNAQPPSAVLTNLSITSAITNLNDNQFAAEATIASIKNGALMTNIVVDSSLRLNGSAQISDTINTLALLVTNDANFAGQVYLNNAAAPLRALYLDAAKKIVVSPGVSSTELEYLDGLTGPLAPFMDRALTNNHSVLATFANDLNVIGGLSVFGLTILSNSTTVYGEVNIVGVMDVSGFVTHSSGMQSDGPSYFNDSIRIPRAAAPTTDEFGEIAADNNAYGASRGAVQFFDGTENTFLVGVRASDTPLDGQVPTFNTGGFITWATPSGSGGGGPGTLPMNSNQFDTNNPVSIKSGALFTNAVIRGATLPNVTADRAAGFNANGDLTNSQAVSMAELEFLDGVTSAIQTQLNGKQNGATNPAQFGASTTLTLRDGVTVTNANLSGTTSLTNPPGATAALRIWQTNGLGYTEFTVPAQWMPTNRFVFWQTNAAAGKVLKVNSVSISGGVATINLTNDFVAGTEVTFSDPNSDFAATDVTSAIAELVSSNGSGPNASDGKVHWQQLVGVPAGFADGTDDGGSASTNVVAIGIGTADITNAVKRWTVHLGNDTNVVLNWSVTNYYICSPSNTFTVSWINAPAAGKPAQSMFLEIVNTNSTAGYFPTNGLNNSPVIMLSAPSTNTYRFHFDGTNFWTESGQILTTGLGDTNVYNVNPVLHNPTNVGSVILLPSSGSVTVIKAAASSAAVTNLTGIIHKSSASTVELDANASARFSVTNRITGNTTLVFTNTSDGQEISVTVLGEASGGSARTLTLIPQSGHLVGDLDTFGTALATSSTLTLTNGNAVEISWKISRLNGTNVAAKVSRQFAF